MALTTAQIGSEIATEKLVIQAITDNPGAGNVTSVQMEVLINSAVVQATLEHLPIIGSTTTFEFEINSIVKDYFASDFLALTGVNQTATENALVSVRLKEIIGNVVQGTTYREEIFIKNITQDVFEIEDFDLTDYDCGDTGSTLSKLMTSAPSPLFVGDNTSFHVSCLTTSYTVGLAPKQEWTIETYLNGVFVAQLTDSVDVPTRGISGEIIGGKYDVSNYRFDFDSSNGYDEVRFYIRDIAGPNTQRSETKVFKLNDACEKELTLSWHNELGQQDSFSFLGNINRVGKYTDSTFKRVRPVNPLSTNVGDLVYKSSYNYEYDLFSDRMPENTVQWLSKMLINKRAAIQTKQTKTVSGLALTNDQYFGNMPQAASYFSLVDAGNGFAYGAPARSGNFLKYDLINDTTSTIATAFPSGVAVQYTFGIKSNINGKIYYMNGATLDVLVFNPVGETHTTIGVLTDFYSFPSITPSGIIYANGNGKVLKIDTNTDTVSEIVAVGLSGGGSSVYYNGFIYFIPSGGAAEYYKLDISNDTIATIAAPLLTNTPTQSVVTSGGKIYTFMDVINDMFVVDTSNDTSYSFDTGVVTAGAYKAVFILSNDNVYLLGSQQADVLKIDTINDSLSIAGVISDNEQYIVAMVVNDKVYAPSENQNEPILKLTFESATVVKPGKYFPIVIETEETVLEDKFTPETIFRVKFRMANRRKGLK
jgi:hypothetical protein